MLTYTFTKADVRKKQLFPGYEARIGIDVSGEDFPKTFNLKSPRTGRVIMMHHLEAESTEYFMSNEGWDGEYNARLYGGLSPEGKAIMVELYTTPQY